MKRLILWSAIAVVVAFFCIRFILSIESWGDLVFFLGFHHPDVLHVAGYILCGLAGVFGALSFGSFRWWWVKRTRLPEMWKQARAEYEKEIASLKARIADLEEQLHRSQTVAHGSVVIAFDRAVNAKE